MRRWLSFLFVLLLLTACGGSNNPMAIPKNALKNLEAFQAKSKFDQDTKKYFYPGLGKPQLKPELTNLINKAGDDFLLTAKNNPTEKAFQDDIKIGLARFTALYLELDTEDKERICHYFEELMDYVGLESSDGLLNDWMYGFDPSKKNN